MSTMTLRDRAAIVGVGHTGCFRDAGVPMGTLALRSCAQAVEDAGLTLKEIDGFCTAGGAGARDISTVLGWNDISSEYMIEALGLPGVNWWANAPLGGVPGMGSVAMAVVAVASGLCDTALACRINWRPKAAGYGHVGRLTAGGVNAFFDPYGFGVFPQKFATWWRRYMHEFGATREQLGTFVVQSRQNALLNDKPIAAPRTPITMDDYLSARWVSEPLGLLDCDYPCDGAAAVVVTTAERARDLKQKPVYVSAVATGQGPRPDFVFWHDYTEMACHKAAEGIWEKAGFSPQDIDMTQIYDGFSPFILYWMEALGFAKRGEAGPFVGSGALAPDGMLPTNLNGGQLNEGRLHAMGHVIEATLQLQRRAGPRQLKKAEVAPTAGGGMAVACILVLHT